MYLPILPYSKVTPNYWVFLVIVSQFSSAVGISNDTVLSVDVFQSAEQENDAQVVSAYTKAISAFVLLSQLARRSTWLLGATWTVLV